MNTQPDCVSRGNLIPFMSRKLGQNADLKLSRAHRIDSQARLKDDCETLVSEKLLRCVLDVPHAAKDIEVVANLTKRTISCAMKLGAPKDKKSTSAWVNWMTRQLTMAETNDMFVKAFRIGNAKETEAPLETLMNDANALDSDTTSVVPSKFEVFYMVDLAGRFVRSKTFIDEDSYRGHNPSALKDLSHALAWLHSQSKTTVTDCSSASNQ